MDRDINQFLNSIDEIFNSIMKIQTIKFVDNFKISLMYSYLDLLSKVTLGNPKGNRERFLHLLENYYEWEYLDFVSVQLIQIELMNEQREQFNDLKRYVTKKLATFPKSQPISLSYDVKYEELIELWPGGLKLNGKYKLEFFTHKNLLYRFRNRLIHEMRPPGSQFNFFEINYAHYVPVKKMDLNPKTQELEVFDDVWQLNYPLEFFVEMCNSVRKNLERYIRDNSINPYNSYYFGHSWFVE